MANIRTCKWCGRKYDVGPYTLAASAFDGYDKSKFCSAKCAAGGSSSGNFSGGGSSSADLTRRMKIIIPAIGILIIIGLIVIAINGIKNALSDTKIEIVSASCETDKEYVSLVNKALSKVSVTVLEGEDFTTYANQARDAVIKREGEYGLFKDSVYFVKLPDNVNAYIWFKTKDQVAAHVYKINKTK